LNWQWLGLRVAGVGLLAVTGAIRLDLYLTGYRSIPEPAAGSGGRQRQATRMDGRWTTSRSRVRFERE
jgi:hypothetical protein